MRGISWVIGIVVAIILAVISFFIIATPLQFGGEKGLGSIIQPGQKAMEAFPVQETECKLLCMKYQAGESVDLNKLKICEEKFHLGCYNPNYETTQYATERKITLSYCPCIVSNEGTCIAFYDEVKDILINGMFHLWNPSQLDCNQACRKFFEEYCNNKNGGDVCELANSCVYVQT